MTLSLSRNTLSVLFLILVVEPARLTRRKDFHLHSLKNEEKLIKDEIIFFVFLLKVWTIHGLFVQKGVRNGCFSGTAYK